MRIWVMIDHGILCEVILCTGQACNSNSMFIHCLTSVQNPFEEHAMGTTSYSVLMLFI